MAESVRLILASGSSARREMLAAAGVAFDVVPADIDEAAIRAEFSRCDLDANNTDMALTLAAAKAATVSKAHPEALVVGSDQILALPPKIFSKARNTAEARETLRQLRGETHRLTSAAALARSGDVIWQTWMTAHMTMRKFSDAFLEDYVCRAGKCLTSSAGAYEFEGLGSQLFDDVEGDYFTILGLPLLPLLAELRRQGILRS